MRHIDFLRTILPALLRSFHLTFQQLCIRNSYASALAGNYYFLQYLAILCVWLSMSALFALGFLVSATVPEKHMGTTAVLLITFFFAYSGFFVPFEEMPPLLRWLKYTNLFHTHIT